jgi:hypothetical protein
MPHRGIGACIAPGLGLGWKGQRSAKQSAAIFSGIPVLRGDFGRGGERVQQFYFNVNMSRPSPLGFSMNIRHFEKPPK